MSQNAGDKTLQTCKHCEKQGDLDFDFTMAFQPIVNIKERDVFAHEALVRGLDNEPAYSVIERVNAENRYRFDQLCRVKAIALAAKLNMQSSLSINFLPNAVYEPTRCLRTTIEAANKHHFPIDRILFEFTEVERMTEHEHVKYIVERYRSLGLMTAIDDFGAGYSGLDLLANLQTNFVKLDMGLIRGIDSDPVRQAIVKHSLALLNELQITPVVEGVETLQEYQWLKSQDVDLMQGFLFARPGFECLPEIDFPE